MPPDSPTSLAGATGARAFLCGKPPSRLTRGLKEVRWTSSGSAAHPLRSTPPECSMAICCAEAAATARGSRLRWKRRAQNLPKSAKHSNSPSRCRLMQSCLESTDRASTHPMRPTPWRGEAAQETAASVSRARWRGTKHGLLAATSTRAVSLSRLCRVQCFARRSHPCRRPRHRRHPLHQSHLPGSRLARLGRRRLGRRHRHPCPPPRRRRRPETPHLHQSPHHRRHRHLHRLLHAC